MKPENYPQLYESLLKELNALLDNKHDLVTNANETAQLLFYNLPDINWAGFYLFNGDHLTLGPFYGPAACKKINLGQGVCGTAAKEQRSIIVDDVTQFPGYIACDKITQSEIVVPLIQNNQLLGVLDIDSPHKARFTEIDKIGLEPIVASFIQHTDGSKHYEPV